jgi:biopolymer transport protein ExbD
VLSIDRTGQAYLDARPVTEMALVHALRAYPPEQLVVIADPTVPHGRVVRLIDLARVAGVARFSLQTPLMDDARP